MIYAQRQALYEPNGHKRVDHEAGRHRTRRAAAEPMACEVCGNVYADRRWTKPDPERRDGMIGWEKDKRGRVTVTTTTEHLAQRLGHALEKAFDGEVRYDFSHENKLAHVYWRRD